MTGLLILERGTAKLPEFSHDPMFDGIQLMSLMGLAGILVCAGPGARSVDKKA